MKHLQMFVSVVLHDKEYKAINQAIIWVCLSRRCMSLKVNRRCQWIIVSGLVCKHN